MRGVRVEGSTGIWFGTKLTVTKVENYFRLKENKETGHLNAMQDLRQPLDQENVPKDFTGTTSKT